MTTNKTTLTLAMAAALATGAYGLAGSTWTHAAESGGARAVATTPSGEDAAEDAREAADRANEAAEDANEAADYAAAQSQASRLTRAQIVAKLTAVGYTDIHDLEFGEDGVWKAEATEPNTGEEVDLWIDGVDGHVLKKNDD